jgi:hypothetical protein
MFAREQAALRTHEGERGYQPMLAVRAEMDAGRLVRHARSLVPRLAATVEEIALWREARQLLPVGT